MDFLRKGLVPGILAFLGLLGFAIPGSAIAFHSQPTFTGVVELSTLAFRGQVVGVRYAMTSTPTTGLQVPYTAFTFYVQRAYRGTTDGATVVIYQYGGPIAGTDAWEGVDGLPSLKLGDHVAIFANDSFQFAAATLYADYGLRRFVDHEGGLITLTAGWTAVMAGVENLEDLRQCLPSAVSRTQCSAWVDADGNTSSAPLPTGGGARLVTAAAFDLQVAGMLPSGPGPTLPAQQHDETSFAAQLGLFIEAISVPSAFADLPVR